MPECAAGGVLIPRLGLRELRDVLALEGDARVRIRLGQLGAVRGLERHLQSLPVKALEGWVLIEEITLVRSLTQARNALLFLAQGLRTLLLLDLALARRQSVRWRGGGHDAAIETRR